MEPYLDIVSDLGFSIATAIACGYFVFLTIKFILDGVTNNVNTLTDIVIKLDSRVKLMIDTLHRIDTKVSHTIGLAPDYSRISRTITE